MDRASLEQLLDHGLSLAEIGQRFGKDASTVGYWVKKHGLRAIGSEKYAPRGGLRREELEPLVEQGATLAQIADEVDRSLATVRYWLAKYGLRTQCPKGPPRRPGVHQARVRDVSSDGRLSGMARPSTFEIRVGPTDAGNVVLIPSYAVAVRSSRSSSPRRAGAAVCAAMTVALRRWSSTISIQVPRSSACPSAGHVAIEAAR